MPILAACIVCYYYPCQWDLRRNTSLFSLSCRRQQWDLCRPSLEEINYLDSILVLGLALKPGPDRQLLGGFGKRGKVVQLRSILWSMVSSHKCLTQLRYLEIRGKFCGSWVPIRLAVFKRQHWGQLLGSLACIAGETAALHFALNAMQRLHKTTGRKHPEFWYEMSTIYKDNPLFRKAAYDCL